MASWTEGKWFIDALVIKAAAEPEQAGNENFLAPHELTQNIWYHNPDDYVKQGGHKWMIQAVYYDASGGTTTLGPDSGHQQLRLRVRTHFQYGTIRSRDFFFEADYGGTTHTIHNGDSVYFGYSGTDIGLGSGADNQIVQTGPVDGYSAEGIGLRLLADQSVARNNTVEYAMTDFVLEASGSGGQSWAKVDKMFNNPGGTEARAPAPANSLSPTSDPVEDINGIFLVQRDNSTTITRLHLTLAGNSVGSLTGPYYVIRRRARQGATATAYLDNDSIDNGVIGTVSPTATPSGSVPSKYVFVVDQWAWISGSTELAQSHVAVYNGQAAATASGDPHITTLAGEHYEFDYLGPFRLYEATTGDQKLTINALAKLGPGRWNEKQYLRELYIQHGDKWAHVDMGFRGSPLKILESGGLEHEEKDLEFDPGAKRYSFSSHYRTTDWMEPVTEDLPALVRNAIDFVIAHTKTGVPSASIHLENVNKYNLQPCRTIVHPVKDAADAKGCLVARRYASVAPLDDLRDTTPLREPTKEDLDRMPELEIAPIKRNVQWQ